MVETPITTLKILFIGETGVGKSCLLLRFAEDIFDEDGLTSTIGLDYKSKVITVLDQKVQLSLWDTAGSERFRTFTPGYYREAQGAILVYDVTRRESFEKIDSWRSELDTYSTHQNLVRMLVGNKVDRGDSNRQITKQEGINYARRHQMLFVETSARTCENVFSCFEKLVTKILHTPNLWEPTGGNREANIRLRDNEGLGEDEGGGFCSYCNFFWF